MCEEFFYPNNGNNRFFVEIPMNDKLKFFLYIGKLILEVVKKSWLNGLRIGTAKLFFISNNQQEWVTIGYWLIYR